MARTAKVPERKRLRLTPRERLRLNAILRTLGRYLPARVSMRQLTAAEAALIDLAILLRVTSSRELAGALADVLKE